MSPRPIQVYCLLLSVVCRLDAAYQDEIGLFNLRDRNASLTGSGILVGQIEAQRNDTDDYQVDPANAGLNPDQFTYFDTVFNWSDGGSTFDSNRESGHANTVGSRFYGVTTGTQNTDGVAPGVAAVDVFEAGHYYNALVQSGTDTGAHVVNQSFIFPSADGDIDRDYDDYAALFNVLFVNGISNDGSIPSPASSYNGIAVNVAGDSASPPADGRSKPDISAPGSSVTSFVTPLVSGAASILIQSALADDAGEGTSALAADIRTVKALLLNGARKPEGWTNSRERPLDTDYGSGILEINQSHLQLVAGQFAPTRNEVLTEADSPHLPPIDETGSVGSYRGWNLGTVTNTADTEGPPQNRKQYDVTDHYFFDLSSDDAATFALTATLVWNRQSGQSNLNNLELILYSESGTLIASSESSVDNVEHIHQPQIPAGRYVLQIHKPYNSGRITDAETYALAFDFQPIPPPAAPDNLSITTISSSDIDLGWSDQSNDEDGFKIERRRPTESYAEIATVTPNITTYSDSGLRAGTVYDYRITAFNSAGESTAGEISGRTYSKIEDWRLRFFGTTANAGNAANNFDEDQDSIINVVEYVTGSDPTVFSENPLDTSLLGSMGQVSFKWRIESGYNFALGYANNLKDGFIDYDSATLDSGASPEIELLNVSSPVDGFETRTYGLKNDVTEPRVFLRLRVNE